MTELKRREAAECWPTWQVQSVITPTPTPEARERVSEGQEAGVAVPRGQ